MPRSTARALVLALALAGAGAGLAAPPNGDFEQAGAGGLPAAWVLDAKVKGKGTVRLVEAAPGAAGRMLELRPNASNGRGDPLGVGQVLDAAAWRGRRIAVEAVLGAERGATAVVGVQVLEGGQPLQLVQGDSGGAMRRHRGVLDVPPNAARMVVYAVATGGSGRALFDALAIGPEGAAPAAADASREAEARIRVDVARLVRPIPPGLFGVNVEWVWDGQGLWSSKRQALDPDLMALGRELRPTVVRFPGGGFSDAYHWRDGIGPRDARPETPHHPGGPRSRHALGSLEIREFAEAVGAELLITVNAGTGTAREAAEWVAYMNREGARPVRHWEVGNELYMKDDLSGAHLSAAEYARRYLAFAAAMRQADPRIRVGAIGGLNHGAYRFIADDRWTETVLARAAGEIDFLAIHNAYAPVVIAGGGGDPRAVYRAMLAAPMQIEENLAEVSRLLARHEKPGRPISIAVTEWGPLFHVSPSSPWVDHPKTMGSALFTASAMNAFLRSPRVAMAHYFKWNDLSFMGLVGRRDGQWIPTASFRVLALYRRVMSGDLVAASVEGPRFDAPAVGVVAARRGVPVVDAVAATDGRGLAIVAVNRSEQAVAARFELDGVRARSTGRVESVHADSLDANTGTQLPRIEGLDWAKQASLGRFERGAPGEIRLGTGSVPAPARPGETGFELRLAPLSVTAVVFESVSR